METTMEMGVTMRYVEEISLVRMEIYSCSTSCGADCMKAVIRRRKDRSRYRSKEKRSCLRLRNSQRARNSYPSRRRCDTVTKT